MALASPLVPTMPDPPAAASAAGLRYVNDRAPGIRRVRAGGGFRYVAPDGRTVRDANVRARIRSLAIPPAWKDVWICASPDGHIQAVGRDQKGRKQYRYHPRWRAVRDEAKYERMIAFARALPKLRARVEEDLSRPGLPREKVLAAVLRLLESTLIRVGNDEYARQNRSYGLTTLHDRHARVRGSRIEFRFRGKSGKSHVVGLEDRRLSRIVKRCQDLPGEQLFQYVDDGRVVDIESGDVNEYLREISGLDFTAKDFRTWAGTVLAAWALADFKAVTSVTQAKKNIVKAIERVAGRLGNTTAVCRKCYVHPAVFESYLDGSLVETLRARVGRTLRDATALTREEVAVVALLARRLASEAQRRGPVAARRARKERSSRR